MRERLLRPGSLFEGLLFVAGVILGMTYPLAEILQDLAPGNRSMMLSGWGASLAIGWWSMAAAFQAAQDRQIRRDLLSPRHLGVVGPFVAGGICGLLYFGLCSMELLFEWLPSLLVQVAGACTLSFMASRALWRKESS